MEGSPHKSARLSGLDGLRCIAILLVILSHLCSRLDAQSQNFVLRAIVNRAAWGVVFFFVISGFLITWLLVSEQDKSGSIDLVRFYQRRFLRILPPAFAYLLVVRVMTMCGVVYVPWADVAKCVFFIRNVARTGSLETIHFWSLSIEEQFYLCWPLFMLLTRRRLHIPITVFFVIAAPFWRLINYHVFGAARDQCLAHRSQLRHATIRMPDRPGAGTTPAFCHSSADPFSSVLATSI